MELKTITTRLPISLYQDIKIKAAMKDCSIQDIITVALEKYLKEIKNEDDQ